LFPKKPGDFSADDETLSGKSDKHQGALLFSFAKKFLLGSEERAYSMTDILQYEFGMVETRMMELLRVAPWT
jgi:hypothetical protein